MLKAQTQRWAPGLVHLIPYGLRGSKIGRYSFRGQCFYQRA